MGKKNELEGNQNTTSKFQKFLYWFLIPLLFALAVMLLVFTLLGHNVFQVTKEYGQKIPILSSLFTEDQNASMEEFENKVFELEADIKDREARITQLEGQLETKDLDIERAQLEKERLQQEIDELRAIRDENKRAFKDIIKTYETISAKKAAPIITEMEDSEAVRILANVKPDTLASIMENLDPANAARMTGLLTAAKENEDGAE
ncbi:MotE family protein [Cytobacillus gottheilii]|uniref:Magnesium transporter MgtE intracellular domain-containing protein n=1 Tax=Cytobacillus gottheilii TaxID=859144 RepID=A0ABX8FGZ4_9BACI|nr:hypothetical protein [Cytobacillus gottheilii]QVY63292.1 hypothetical protein J1899_09680 [Cytobacillus gottheilii]